MTGKSLTEFNYWGDGEPMIRIRQKIVWNLTNEMNGIGTIMHVTQRLNSSVKNTQSIDVQCTD